MSITVDVREAAVPGAPMKPNGGTQARTGCVLPPQQSPRENLFSRFSTTTTPRPAPSAAALITTPAAPSKPSVTLGRGGGEDGRSSCRKSLNFSDE